MNPKKQKNMEPSSFQHSAGAACTSINHQKGLYKILGVQIADMDISPQIMANVSIETNIYRVFAKTVKVHRNSPNS